MQNTPLELQVQELLNSGGNTLDEKLQCAFASIGVQIGDLMRCIISQEIASNLNRVSQLNNILNGGICDTSAASSTPSSNNI
jgi:hypothetical protein